MLQRVIQKALRTPWAITGDYLAIVQDVLIARARGLRLTDDEIQQRIEAQTGRRAAARTEARADGVIAVIPIHGVICNRSFEASSGCTSAEYISRMTLLADQDPAVKAILYDVSSPGGTVEGVPEVAKVIRSASKATVGFIDALSASAAYWLTSQMDEIVIRESASVGSIGVYTLLEDWSDFLAKEGIKVNAISAGEFKLEGAPWEPLSEEARAFIQGEVDACYSKFLAAVAAGRGVGVAEVRKKYGQGRCVNAAVALEAGMVDRIGELDVAIARANTLARKAKPNAHASAQVSAGAFAAAIMAAARDDDDDEGERPTTAVVVAAAAPSRTGLEPSADGTCPVGYEPGEDGLCYAVEPDEEEEPAAAMCATCNGSGLKPEGHMGDPQGQEPCPDCQAGQDRQARADRDALEVARA